MSRYTDIYNLAINLIAVHTHTGYFLFFMLSCLCPKQVKTVKPDVLLGLSAVGGLFSEKV